MGPPDGLAIHRRDRVELDEHRADEHASCLERLEAIDRLPPLER